MSAKRKAKSTRNPSSNTIDTKDNLSNSSITKDTKGSSNTKDTKHPLKYTNKNKSLKLEHKDPSKYKSILNDLKEGKSLTETASNNDCSRNTVDRIKYDNKDQLTQWKWKQSEKIGEIIEKGLKVLDENIDNVPKASLPLAIGILIDKKDQFDSAITPDVNKTSVIAHVNLNELIDNLSTSKVQRHEDSAKTIDI